MDVCWDILQDYVLEIPVLPLTSGDFQFFKQDYHEEIESTER